MDKLMKLIAGMFEYYDRKASEVQIKVYIHSLKSYDYSDISRAFNSHIKDPDAGQFMPKVADFIRAMQGTKKSQASVAWSKVDKAIRQLGPYNTIVFDDPIIMQCIDQMGGWESLCETATEKDLDFKGHEFNRFYEGYLAKGGVTEYPKQLSGIIDKENKAQGIKSDVLLIGDSESAKSVYNDGGDEGVLAITSMSNQLDDTVKRLTK